ncbi:MAG: hypothetical protein K2I46_02120 [Clostridia bacterium]|nr:hypothetical protein [Clostridia bacterium]MDE6472365.1 hypothetical protein [Clostridia bacterium]
MLSFISDTYGKFQSFMASWKVWQIVAFAVAIPVIVILIQLLINLTQLVYVKANFRLKKFLKSYSYLSPSNVFSFNKKVVKGFPKYIKRQTKHIADSGMPMEEYLNTFNFCNVGKRRSIVGTMALAHIILLGVVVAMNGFSVGIVSTAILATFAVWFVALVIDFAVYRLFNFVDRKFKRKFLIKLDVNTLYEEKSVDLTLPKEEVVEDSAMQLANTVEDFLASQPDKGIAKVVLKGLYSAKFSSAMTAQSKLRLKNVVTQLKNYVG